MRYTEKKYDFYFDNFFDIIRVVFLFLFLSPFRLINEISKKVIYLGKELIEKILIGSIVMCSFLIVVSLIIQLFRNKLSILKGPIPIISGLICLLLLGVLYCYLIINTRSPLNNINASLSAPIQVEKSEESVEATIDLEIIEEEPHIEVKEESKEVLSDFDKAVEDFCSESVNSFQGTLREDEFLENREKLDKSVQEDKFNLSETLDKFMGGDFFLEDFNLDFTESASQSLYFSDEV